MTSTHFAHAVGLVLVTTACGQIDVQSSSQPAAPLPNLRFVGSKVEVLVPGQAQPLLLSKDQQLQIPCNAAGVRVRYTYANRGGVAVGKHVNAGITLGGETYPFPQPPLAAGASRRAVVSWGQFAAINTPITVAIRLDYTGVVAERIELDNLWKAKVVRSCP